MTQEMGMRLTVITRKGLADLIREKFGARAALFMFMILAVANIGTLITEISAAKTTSRLIYDQVSKGSSFPQTVELVAVLAVVLIVIGSFAFIVRGNYKSTQGIMLIASLFFLVYIFSAFKASPDWGMALSNLLYPHGVVWTSQYTRDYLIIGMGVLGTTITPWGQFFIGSFSYDKKIEKGKVNYSQLETYWGAFLTDFFTFFMIVATAATLFTHGIELVSGEQAALAIQPFAGKLAGILFAVGILNAGFMGLVIVSLSTAYAFAEFFGLSGSLNDNFKQGKTFYILYIVQLILATLIVIGFRNISLFKIAVVTQIINAIGLPFVFYYLIKLTSDKNLMGEYTNNKFQKYFAIICTVVIVIASLFTMASLFIKS